jgi:hypothetical protein
MTSRLEDTVCSSCGEADCWNGFLMCEDARTASTMPRWRWERNQAVTRLAALAPSAGMDGSLLHAVAVIEEMARD